MKAEAAFTSLLAAARALKPYTTPQRSHTRNRLLYLRTDSDILTLSATTGDETAHVAVPGAVADGTCAVARDTLIRALTAIKPGGRAARAATVRVPAADGQLHLDLDTGSASDSTPTIRPRTRRRSHWRTESWSQSARSPAGATWSPASPPRPAATWPAPISRPAGRAATIRRSCSWWRPPTATASIAAPGASRPANLSTRACPSTRPAAPYDCCAPSTRPGRFLVHTDDATVTWHTSQ
ncbi:hypothetical protein [Micromonospora sp. WMMD1082]|uniref:hypothetical protein n=1 Tax=Micromonospora sp. WMMD1082 TaxID=3016104 RepID=UPI002416C1F3|nr:hypothetical protein [Micromonospora sp. WMMD1082]MDG4795411.1 hypothetical protein [Micromonospora sp. WMMD1082]